MANRSRKGRCGVFGRSACVTNMTLGTSPNSQWCAERTRSRSNQQGSQARPWPASAASAMASASSKRRRLGGVASTSVWRSPTGNSQVRMCPVHPVNDAGVARKVAQPLGPAMLCEISGCAADCHALNYDRARHQASAVTDIAAPDREIEAILD